MRNKYTNKSLKNGNVHFNNYRGNTGYIKVNKPTSFFTMLKWLTVIIAMLIIVFYLLTKFL